MANPTAEHDVEDFLAHFGAKGMRWGILDPSSKAEEVGSAPFIREAGAPPGQGVVQDRQGQEAQVAEQESKTADAEAQQALQDLSDIHAEQTQVAAQAHVAAQAAAQAHAAAPTPATASAASDTAAQAQAEKTQLAEVAADAKSAAKAEAENKTLQAKLNALEKKDKTAAAKLKTAKAKALLKKTHAAKLKAIAKKAKAARAKHKALTAEQKKKKAAYEKAHPEAHKPLTAEQKAQAAAKEKLREQAHKTTKPKPAVKKAVSKTTVHKTAPKSPAKPSVAEVAGKARFVSHSIDNSDALLPHDQPVKKGAPVANEPTAAARKMFAKMHLAMPDGSYYIRNGDIGASDLQNAIDSVGRGETAGDSGNGIRKFIMGRAAKLKLSSKIPDTWNPDGSLKHDDLDAEIENFLEHFGVNGMHWGVRKAGSSEPSSEDHARAYAIQAKVKAAGGTHTLSNDELKTLNQRKQLESEHARLSGTGESFVKGLIVKQGKQEANKYAAEYAVKGAAAVATIIAGEAARQKFKGKHA